VKRHVARLAVTVCTSAVLLAGCSSGHSKPTATKQQLVAKLSQETEFSQLKRSVDQAKIDLLVGCIADYLLDKGKGSDIDAYVAGTKQLDSVKGFDSESNAEKVGKDCVAKAGIPTATSSS